MLSCWKQSGLSEALQKGAVKACQRTEETIQTQEGRKELGKAKNKGG